MDSAVIALAEISNLKLIKGFPTSRASHAGEIPCRSVSTIKNNDVSKFFTSKEEIGKSDSELSEAQDILISVEGGSAGEILIVTEEMGEFVPSQQVVTLRVVDKKFTDPWYVAAFLSSSVGQTAIDQLSQGVGIKRIPLRNLQDLMLPLPALEEQRKIGGRFHALIDSIAIHKAVINCFQDLLEAQLDLAFYPKD